MQVIAPDFYASLGGKSSTREEERTGGGKFDALLREEDARHAREPQRERRETAWPANDDSRLDRTRHDAPHAKVDEAVDEPVDRQDRPAENVAGDTGAETAPAPGEARRDRGSDAGAQTAKPSEDTTGSGSPQVAAATTGQAAASGTDGKTPPPAVPGVPAVDMTKAAASNPAAQAAQAGPAAGTTPPAGAAGAPPGATAAATPETTAQPASGAAAAQRAADKASPVATGKEPNQVAAAHREAPTIAPADAAGRPADRSGQASGQPGVVVTPAATLEARPAAALGGAAATVAQAQAAEGQAKTGTAAANATATGASPTAPDGALPPAAGRPTAQANQAAKGAEMPTAAGDKAAGGAPTAAGAPAEPAGPSAGQTLTATATATGGTSPLQNASFAETLTQARHGTAANPAEQIAVQVQRAQVAGQDQISIKLHPAELGRIEVKLENASDGTLRAIISAERSDTLDLLQRDARGLERALQEAGVKTDSGSLSFNLRGQGQQQEQQARNNGGSGRGGPDGRANAGEAAPPQDQAHRSSHSGTLDIRV